jgi:RluA family pseudouridine synthase
VTPATARSLLDVLKERFPDSSTATLRKMLQTDRVRVNGSPERNAKRPIAPGDRVDVGSKRELRDRRVAILHEDADLIVIDKASGLLTVASPTETAETVVAIVDDYLGAGRGGNRVHVVHRLDRDSSGVLVFAKNADMRGRLQALFEAHDIDRVYIAVVHGRLPAPSGTFRSRLVEDRDLRVRSTLDGREGKQAITRYRTLASGPRYTMLEVTLETGRRNQIRVHLAEAGHPVLGDTMYGAGREDPLGRLALHACRLGFVHPRTGRKLVFEAPTPQGFRDLTL